MASPKTVIGTEKDIPFAYILRSEKDNKYYYGSTRDLKNRLQDHNNGKVKSTKGRRPFRVHYFEQLANISEARKRENFFKSIEGYYWLKEQKII